ncbi:DUF2071 domain-containing protein [Kitasatospora aureofaciens]|uniref:DUF2071 domain-containing protein n=1 Tax=Kitasatospora aureofaciens TaxID=1894 RepID=UPI001C47020B|nr:DUF2071 domain-containing protein [Kitasatospora aureofaciens]MBV6698454.1 DUF2071 domain-containing protein [Kitasatospora aureofaciens]
MIQPNVASTVERRLLVNYRVDPGIAARLLPAPLRPQLIRGHAVAGICLIRLGDVRPAWAPFRTGLRSENAAHRIAVEWDGPHGVETGVYIPRRDTTSRLSTLVGGRLFPGVHHRADFDVRETPDRLDIAYASRDRTTQVRATVAVTESLTDSTLFTNLAEASAFFRGGSKGYSATRHHHLDGMTLNTDAWHMETCRPLSVESSFFDDPDRFPPGSATLDSALLMRDLPARWQPLPTMATA